MKTMKPLAINDDKTLRILESLTNFTGTIDELSAKLNGLAEQVGGGTHITVSGRHDRFEFLLIKSSKKETKK